MGIIKNSLRRISHTPEVVRILKLIEGLEQQKEGLRTELELINDESRKYKRTEKAKVVSKNIKDDYDKIFVLCEKQLSPGESNLSSEEEQVLINIKDIVQTKSEKMEKLHRNLEQENFNSLPNLSEFDKLKLEEEISKIK